MSTETMDDASITTKLAVIDRVKTTFSEGESMIKALILDQWRASTLPSVTTAATPP